MTTLSDTAPPRDACFHDVNLGERLSPDRIAVEVHAMREHPGVNALLQHLRNTAMALVGASHDQTAAGQDAAAKLSLGAHQGVTDVFFDLVRWTGKLAEAAKEK